jgi:glucokinase
MILAGDIGGTKTILSLFKREGKALKSVVKRQYTSRDFETFGKVVAAFLEEVRPQRVDAACFGIAGPVIEGNCHTTNLAWEITTASLQRQLGIEQVRLLNDLEATAYGMLYLKEEEFYDLNPYGKPQEGNRAVIAAGTGLGEAILFWDGEGFHPSASEGGHCDFASITPQQDRMLNWLRNRYRGHVSYERIVSGPGIYTLYEFLRETGFAPEPVYMQGLDDDVDKSAMVSRCALEYKDPLCSEALRLFVEIYAQEAGNLALKSLALGGIYIGGGIAPKILPFLKDAHFLNAFIAKGRFGEMLRSMEIRVALNPETALLGAARFADDKLLEKGV